MFKVKSLDYEDRISQDDLKKIYELTYKYQILTQESKYSDYGLPGQLPDKAYMQLTQIESDLENNLDHALEVMLFVYDGWVVRHATPSKEGLQNTIVEREDERLKLVVRTGTLQEIAAEFGEKNILDSLNTFISGGTYEEDLSKFEPFIDKYRKDIVSIIMLSRYFYDKTMAALTPESEQAALESWESDTELGAVKVVFDKLNSSGTLDLSGKIILFQEALTTAHNNGEMSEYLIDSSEGESAADILDGLSEGVYTAQWDKDITRLLGHPPGSTATPKDVWFTPAHKMLSHIDKAIRLLAQRTHLSAAIDLLADASIDSLIEQVRSVLSTRDDLRKPKYRGMENPYAGHCYVASEALYHLLGGKATGYKPMFISHEGEPHWFLTGPSGEIIDATAEQFNTPVPYERAVGKGFLTAKPSARAQEVIDFIS